MGRRKRYTAEEKVKILREVPSSNGGSSFLRKASRPSRSKGRTSQGKPRNGK